MLTAYLVTVRHFTTKTVYSIDSVLGGGQNFYDANGQHVGYSIDSIIGNRQNLYSNTDGFAGYAIDSVFGGGQDIFFDDGSLENI